MCDALTIRLKRVRGLEESAPQLRSLRREMVLGESCQPCQSSSSRKQTVFTHMLLRADATVCCKTHGLKHNCYVSLFFQHTSQVKIAEISHFCLNWIISLARGSVGHRNKKGRKEGREGGWEEKGTPTKNTLWLSAQTVRGTRAETHRQDRVKEKGEKLAAVGFSQTNKR